MPPRASVRRSARVSSREPEAMPSTASPSNFQRLQLPPLHGTPSSRRLYSYGSGAEPPKKPGSGLQKGQVMDIGHAVQNALTRYEKEKADDEIFVRPPRPQARPTVEVDDDEDELAGNDTASQRTQRPMINEPRSTARGAGSVTSMRQMSGASDDSQRSFAIESDYYVDATIASTPGTTPTPESPPASHQTSPTNRQNLPRKDVAAPSRVERETARNLTETTNAPSARADRYQLFNRPRPDLRNQEDSQATEDDDEESKEDSKEESEGEGEQGNEGEIQEETEEEVQEESEEEPPTRDDLLAHNGRTNTPALNRNLMPSTREPPLRNAGQSRNPFAARKLPEKQGSLAASTNLATRARGPTLLSQKPTAVSSRQAPKIANTSQNDSGLNQRLGAIQPAEPIRDPRKTLNPGLETNNRPPLFAHNKVARHNGNRLFADTETQSSDSSEQDAAMQADIQEAEEEAARELRERQIRAQHHQWRRKCAWFWSLCSLDPLRRRLVQRRAREQPRRDDDPVEEEVDADDERLDLWRFLNPMTYIHMLVSLIDTAMDHTVSFLDRVFSLDLRQQLADSLETISWIVVGVFVLLGSFMISHFVNQSSSFYEEDMSFDPIPGHGRWPSFGQLTDKIGSLIPSMPAISWPSRNRDDEYSWELGNGNNFKDAEEYLEKYQKDLSTLKEAAEHHRASLKRLESVLPQVVQMELRDGRPVVTQEFWHGLRDMIKGDGSFLTMDEVRGSYRVSSEGHWRGIMSHLIKDPAFTSKLNQSISALEGRFDDKMTNGWNSWIKNNDDKIAAILGPALDKIRSAGSGREFEQRLSRIVKEQLQGDQTTIVTRREFLQHLKTEFATHRAEMRAELDEIRPQLDALRESVRVLTQNTPQGMSKAEVTTLVNQLVRKVVADMDLGALANGKIHQHLDAILRNHVNYFNIGAGATIDGKRTSTTWNPLKKKMLSEKLFVSGIRGLMPYPPVAALVPWQDEGDCWCAARSINHRGNPHGAAISVQLGHYIIPQHVVVEHMLPGGTSDPDARPKNLEVYAHIADAEVRRDVEAFAATHFPPGDYTEDEKWNAHDVDYGSAFVKIGQFRYEGAELHGGVHVHRLSSELAEAGAATDQVVIRATSNYGAQNHTCFYRVRLFGEKVDLKPSV